MGTKYPGVTSSGYNSGAPADDGSQVASNLVTWAGVKTKLADPIKTLADAENTALVAALDLSARAISSPDTAIASDHWKTLQVTGTTAITLSSAASMGAGYEVGVFNAGVGVVTVTPGAASDTINGVSASVTVSIKGTKIFRTNQALTGYNVVGGYDPQTITASTSMVTPLVSMSGNTASPSLSGDGQGASFTQTAEGLVLSGRGSSHDVLITNKNAASVLIVPTGTQNAQFSGSLFWGTGTANFGTITKRKTADESVTSSTALQDDDHLTFAIAANEEWVATFYLDAGAVLSTTGLKVAITVPSGATLNASTMMMGTTLSATASYHTTTSGAAMDGTTAVFFSGTGSGAITISVWCLNGATPGNVTLQFAQSTSSGTAVTLRKGSFMQATRVA